MGGVVDGTCHCTGLLAGGCGSMRSCIFLIFMPADFTPCIFAFLITEVLMDKVSGGPLDVMALVLRCFTTTGECFCSEEDAAGTGSGRSDPRGHQKVNVSPFQVREDQLLVLPQFSVIRSGAHSTRLAHQ